MSLTWKERGAVSLVTCIAQTLHQSDSTFRERLVANLAEMYEEAKGRSDDGAAQMIAMFQSELQDKELFP